MNRQLTASISRSGPGLVTRLAPREQSYAPIGGLLGTIFSLAAAILATALPIFFHLIGHPVGIFVSVVIALMIANFLRSAVPIVLIFSYLFQNFFVALVSPNFTDPQELDPIRGYNFILTVTTWGTLVAHYWLNLASYNRSFRTLITLTTGALALAGLYFALGFFTGAEAAIVYLRNIVTPFLLFQIFAIVAYRSRVLMTHALIAVTSAALIFGYLDVFAHDAFFPLFNGDVYQFLRIKQEFDGGRWVKEMQETGHVFRSYQDAMVISAFNTPFLNDLQLQFYRPGGPNFHPISFAYAIAILGLLLAMVGHWWIILLTLPLLLIISSKGAILLLIAVAFGILTLRRLPGYTALWMFSALLLAYVASGMIVGIAAQDYHVLGFIGSLKGFLGNPLGHGIGAGGNLSIGAIPVDWSRAQQLGFTDVAVESAVGVLLYQMGVAGAVVLGILVWISIQLWKSQQQSRDRIAAAVAFALVTSLANGVFQEEAMFAPLALGLVLAFAGLLLGRANRSESPAVT